MITPYMKPLRVYIKSKSLQSVERKHTILSTLMERSMKHTKKEIFHMIYFPYISPPWLNSLLNNEVHFTVFFFFWSQPISTHQPAFTYPATAISKEG